MLINSIQNMFNNKNIDPNLIINIWNKSNIKNIDTFFNLDINLENEAMNPDKRFNIDLNQIRKLNPTYTEDIIRQYALTIELYFYNELKNKLQFI